MNNRNKNPSSCENGFSFWQGWQDLNLRMTESKSVALPLGYIPRYKNGVDDRNRTDDLQGHNLAL